MAVGQFMTTELSIHGKHPKGCFFHVVNCINESNTLKKKFIRIYDGMQLSCIKLRKRALYELLPFWSRKGQLYTEILCGSMGL